MFYGDLISHIFVVYFVISTLDATQVSYLQHVSVDRNSGAVKKLIIDNPVKFKPINQQRHNVSYINLDQNIVRAPYDDKPDTQQFNKKKKYTKRIVQKIIKKTKLINQHVYNKGKTNKYRNGKNGDKYPHREPHLISTTQSHLVKKSKVNVKVPYSRQLRNYRFRKENNRRPSKYL